MNPDKQEILYNEVIERIPEDGRITDAAVQRMPYLRACIKESGRYCHSICSLILQKTVGCGKNLIHTHGLCTHNVHEHACTLRVHIAKFQCCSLKGRALRTKKCIAYLIVFVILSRLSYL